MACSKYISTKETTHAARVSRLLLDPCTDLFRDILRDHVTEIQLPGILQTEKTTLTPILNKAQRELLYPRTGNFTGTYKEFDLSLLYILLRNVSGIKAHQNGWAKSPNPLDRSLSANIDRIRETRNTYCGHAVTVFLSESDFQNLWQELTIIIGELECSLPGGCTTYTDAANLIKTVTMDPEQEKMFLDKIDEQHQNAQDIKDMVVAQQTQLKELKAEQYRHGTKLDKVIIEENRRDKNVDSECRNIIENTKAVLEAHKLQKVNKRTSGVQNTIEKLKESHIAILTGRAGSGKTTTAYQVMCEMSDPSIESPYTPVLIKLPEQWVKVINPNYRYLVFLDDVIGLTNLDKGAVEKWRNQLDVMIACAKTRDVLVLIGLRRNILDEAKDHFMHVNLDDNIVDLSSVDNFTIKDKAEMLAMYEGNCNFKASELYGEEFTQYSRENGLNAVYRLSDREKEAILFINPFYGFPLTCFQFFSRRDFFQLGPCFFKQPDKKLFDAVENMRRAKGGSAFEKVKYCVLCYVFIHGSIEPFGINGNLFKGISEKMKISDVLDIDIKDAISDLSGFFLAKSEIDGLYKFCHETVLETILVSFGQLAPDVVIKHCSTENMHELICTENYKSKPGEVVLKIPKQYFKDLRQRILNDIGDCEPDEFMNVNTLNISLIMYYPVLCDPEFVSFFFNCNFPSYEYESLFLILTEPFIRGKNDVILIELLERFGPQHDTLQKSDLKKDSLKNEIIETKNENEESKACPDKTNLRKSTIRIPKFEISKMVLERTLREFCNFEMRTSVMSILHYIQKYHILHSVLDLINIRTNLTVLHFCVLHGWEDIVDKILKIRSPTKTVHNWSCTHLAAFAGRSVILQKFINFGEDYTEKTLDGFTWLQTALLGLRYGPCRVRMPLLNATTDIPFYMFMGMIFPGSEEYMNVINIFETKSVQHIKDDILMKVDEYENSIVHYLVIHNYIDILNLLLKYNKNIAFGRNRSDLPTALHVAVYLGRPEIVRLLWNMGVRSSDNELSCKGTLESGEMFSGKTMSFDVFISRSEGSKCKVKETCWNDEKNEFPEMKLKTIELVKVVFGNANEFQSVRDFLNVIQQL
ncbi:uncharacterized protein LOC134251480 [Saccostrea cucullata]|uniref:uncharacterized protein LOC134251480 n=1 Tax=Saccostrea cuccullata TaxID=36930 RepID=UPI002ED3C37C